LATSESNPDGFEHEGDTVHLPRVRCGSAPGWLTVCGAAGPLGGRPSRLYLPSVGPEGLEIIVRLLDSHIESVPWSLKSAIGLDRDGQLVERADRTVLYLDVSQPTAAGRLTALLDALDGRVPAASGPGFSAPLRPGIYLGGSGNRTGSYGTRLANLAARVLLGHDASQLAGAEMALAARAEEFERTL
ncbi:MAG: hypothetical protein LBG11_01840, partial [Bifidobacteriaceae bacterium]|nr:hypothetical protein [Bifidobacteriaceae bacterium]